MSENKEETPVKTGEEWFQLGELAKKADASKYLSFSAGPMKPYDEAKGPQSFTVSITDWEKDDPAPKGRISIASQYLECLITKLQGIDADLKARVKERAGGGPLVLERPTFERPDTPFKGERPNPKRRDIRPEDRPVAKRPSFRDPKAN